MRPGKKAFNGYPAHGADIGIYDFVMHPGVLLKIIDYLNLWADESTRIRGLHIVRYEDMRTKTSEVLDGILRCFDTFAILAGTLQRFALELRTVPLVSPTPTHCTPPDATTVDF